MSEPRFDHVVSELRATAPAAPERLRERVRALPEPSAPRKLKWRPALAAAAAIAVALGVGAALIGGFTKSSSQKQVSLGAKGGSSVTRRPSPRKYQDKASQSLRRAVNPRFYSASVPPLAPAARLQDYRAVMRLRVRDLSAATKSAIRTTRHLDGYVAAADYSTGGTTGDSSLDLRVPVDRVQQAIASFTDLGTILSQQISVADLQARLDRLDRQIAANRTTVAKLELKQRRSGLTIDEQTQLSEARNALARLSKSQRSVVREGTYAKISLSLTTRKAAVQHSQPGRFDRFWGDAGDILGKEAIVVLYALVVTGPFLLLGALALLGERVRRRRANTRLLEETG